MLLYKMGYHELIIEHDCTNHNNTNASPDVAQFLFYLSHNVAIGTLVESVSSQL